MIFASPFAQHDFSKDLPDGSITLDAGKDLRFRYRILIHPAGLSVADAFNEFSGMKSICDPSDKGKSPA